MGFFILGPVLVFASASPWFKTARAGEFRVVRIHSLAYTQRSASVDQKVICISPIEKYGSLLGSWLHNISFRP